ncbi:MAG: hypothetical protein JNL57_00380 [Bacteroidetes bacterium]|nr:hypothetical protein [Bacteroidota bacterium]
MAKLSASSFKQQAKIVLAAGTTLVYCGYTHAQKYFSGRYELGITAGSSNYHGDLSHGNPLPFFHPSGGAFFKYNFNGYFGYRLQASYLRASGTDKDDPTYKVRNLSFATDIYEMGNLFEFNFRSFGTNVNDKYWTPYFYTGLNLFLFEPTRMENSDIKLRNLYTEGQKRRYSRLQPSVPIGFGIKTMLQPQKNRGVWILGVEGCWRKTFTDYLDDVKGSYPDYAAMVDQHGLGSAEYSHPETKNGLAPYAAGTMRGDTHLRDYYYYLGFTVSYRFTPLICTRLH